MCPSDDVPQAFLPAGSERQAMDWALVLASQGMDVVVDHEPGGGRMGLRVPAPDERRARELIHRYEEENRGWALRVRMPGGEARVHGLALAWVLALTLVHAANGGMAPARAVFDSAAFQRGEAWRAWTATWLHADVAHLAMNAIFGGLLMGLAMGRYGAGTAMGGALAAGALANALGGWLRPEPYVGLGASGVVMAALGMLAANMFGLWRTRRSAARWVLPTLGAASVLFVQVGTSPKGDVVVHALGFLAGIPAGALAALWPVRRQRWLGGVGWTAAAVTTAWSWSRALGWMP
jgi:membrane associated rhomboid family serine protease